MKNRDDSYLIGNKFAKKSDQPKPTDECIVADREWHMEHGVLMDADGEQIPHGLLDARHNAALAAHRKEMEIVTMNTSDIHTVEQLREQLAAEKENAQNAIAGHERNHAHEILKLEKQLAAERESYKLLEEHAKRENQQLREQLDAEGERVNQKWHERVCELDLQLAAEHAALAVEREVIDGLGKLNDDLRQQLAAERQTD